jgi:hypothetical protein
VAEAVPLGKTLGVTPPMAVIFGLDEEEVTVVFPEY